jgi:hypothetical protein
MKNEIRKIRITHNLGGGLAFLCGFLMLYLMAEGNVRGAAFFLTLESVCSFMVLRSNYTFYKKIYNDNDVTFKVPKIFRPGRTINPNHPKGAIIWKYIFGFIITGFFLGLFILAIT